MSSTLNFVMAVALKNLVMPMSLSEGRKCLMICAFILIQYQSVTDRCMDGFAITVSCSTCIGMLLRDENWTVLDQFIASSRGG